MTKHPQMTILCNVWSMPSALRLSPPPPLPSPVFSFLLQGNTRTKKQTMEDKNANKGTKK